MGKHGQMAPVIWMEKKCILYGSAANAVPMSTEIETLQQILAKDSVKLFSFQENGLAISTNVSYETNECYKHSIGGGKQIRTILFQTFFMTNSSSKKKKNIY